jgi:hypothetical protein
MARDGPKGGVMPKETVYGEQRLYDAEDKNPQVPRIEVMWNREAGHVQIVTKATDAEGGRWAGYPTISTGDNVTLTSVTSTIGDHHVTDGYFVDMGRLEINQLIRNLRRARDQAFGRDE